MKHISVYDRARKSQKWRLVSQYMECPEFSYKVFRNMCQIWSRGPRLGFKWAQVAMRSVEGGTYAGTPDTLPVKFKFGEDDRIWTAGDPIPGPSWEEQLKIQTSLYEECIEKKDWLQAEIISHRMRSILEEATPEELLSFLDSQELGLGAVQGQLGYIAKMGWTVR